MNPRDYTLKDWDALILFCCIIGFMIFVGVKEYSRRAKLTPEQRRVEDIENDDRVSGDW